MSKKKKGNSYTDFNSAEQNDFLAELNEAMDTGGDLPIESSSDSVSEEQNNENLQDMFGALINERLNGEASSDEEAGDSDDTNETNNDSSSEENEEDLRKLQELNFGLRISVSSPDSPFKVMTINDGVKSISIDLNSLKEDPDFTVNDADKDEVMREYAFEILRSCILNFYPSAIASNDIVNGIFMNIESVNEDKFIVHEYFTDDIKLLYYISDDSYETFSNVVDEMIENGYIIDFLICLRCCTSSTGFSFAALRNEYVNQLMLLKKYKKNIRVYQDLLNHDDETDISEKENDTVYDAVNVFSADYDVRDIMDMLMSVSNYGGEEQTDDTDEDDGYDENDSEDGENTSEEIIPGDVVPSEDDSDNATSEDGSDSVVEETDGSDIFGEDKSSEDSIEEALNKEEELESLYNPTSRDRKMDKSQKKPKNNTDGDMIVPRHK